MLLKLPFLVSELAYSRLPNKRVYMLKFLTLFSPVYMHLLDATCLLIFEFFLILRKHEVLFYGYRLISY